MPIIAEAPDAPRLEPVRRLTDAEIAIARRALGGRPVAFVPLDPYRPVDNLQRRVQTYWPIFVQGKTE